MDVNREIYLLMEGLIFAYDHTSTHVYASEVEEYDLWKYRCNLWILKFTDIARDYRRAVRIGEWLNGVGMLGNKEIWVDQYTCLWLGK